MTVRCSLIVPAYNVEPFLPACINSLRNQTEREIEIVIVNDGSTDSTGQCAADFAARDTRIRVVNRPNGGLSAARNSGLQVAKGDYIIFLDSDDWAEPDLVSRMTETARATDADLVVAGCFVDVHDQAERLISRSCQLPPHMVLDNNSGWPSQELTDEVVNLLGYAWNKIYRRDFLEYTAIAFEEGLSLIEDVVFNSAAIIRANRVAFLPSSHVHYVQRPRETLGTAVYSNYLDLRLRAIACLVAVLRHWGVPSEDISAIQDAQALSAVVGAARIAATHSRGSHSERVIMLRRMLETSQEFVLIDYNRSARFYDRAISKLVSRSHYGTAVRVARVAHLAGRVKHAVADKRTRAHSY